MHFPTKNIHNFIAILAPKLYVGSEKKICIVGMVVIEEEAKKFEKQPVFRFLTG